MNRPIPRVATLSLCLDVLAGCASVGADSGTQSRPAVMRESDEKALLDLSRNKWLWMADRKVEQLQALFHDEAAFVHMGATLSKREELEVIESGRIQYKRAEIRESSVKFIDDTAILLNKIQLTAVVSGNEVTNPFVVTEVYVRQGDRWHLASMSFTRLLGE